MNEQSKPLVRIQTYIGLVFLLVVLLALALLGARFYGQLKDSDKSPINHIYLQGERYRTNDEQIRNAITQIARSGLFTTDMNAIREQVESLPWVYRASVRRQWPDAVIIQVNEQQPVARWNDSGWLNAQGQIFIADETEDLITLPRIYAQDNQSELVWDALTEMSKRLAQSDLQIAQLHLNSRQAWQVNLANGLILKLGKRDKLDRIDRFVASFPLLVKQQQEFNYVDLRYDTGFAVGLQ